MSRTISFRGMLTNSTSTEIALQTIDGTIGYKITKFQVMPNAPFAGNTEYVCKIHSIKPGTLVATVDLSDNTILGVAAVNNTNGWGGNLPTDNIVIDNVIFNQDIYVSLKNAGGTAALNYYIELESMKLDTNETVMATLKDMRTTAVTT